jgi:replicative DNA helicase
LSEIIPIQALESGYLPPQALDAEEAVLGAIMIEKDILERTSMIRGDYFYMDAHRLIYEACVSLSNTNQPIDMITVSEQLKKSNHLDLIGGAFYLAKLTQKVSSTANIEYHCAIIYEKWALRELIVRCSDVVRECYRDKADVFAVKNDLNIALDRISVEQGKEAVHIEPVIKRRIKEIDDAQNKKIHITGIDTGYHELNKVIPGWQKGNMIILAGRPGGGKSTAALNFANNAASKGIPVGIFSLEMTENELANNLLGIRAGVNKLNITKNNLTEDNWRFIQETTYDVPIYVDDTSGLSVAQFKAKARKMKKMYGVQMIIVDYLQLMKAGTKVGNREQEISFISQSIKNTAKELDMPIIALAQLSRDVEKRGANSKPMLSDLRESGSLEQDANLVIFIYDENAQDKSDLNPVIELIIAKNRGGMVGGRKFTFHKLTGIFTEYIEYGQQ